MVAAIGMERSAVWRVVVDPGPALVLSLVLVVVGLDVVHYYWKASSVACPVLGKHVAYSVRADIQRHNDL